MRLNSLKSWAALRLSWKNTLLIKKLYNLFDKCTTSKHKRFKRLVSSNALKMLSKANTAQEASLTWCSSITEHCLLQAESQRELFNEIPQAGQSISGIWIENLLILSKRAIWVNTTPHGVVLRGTRMYVSFRLNCYGELYSIASLFALFEIN